MQTRVLSSCPLQISVGTIMSDCPEGLKVLTQMPKSFFCEVHESRAVGCWVVRAASTTLFWQISRKAELWAGISLYRRTSYIQESHRVCFNQTQSNTSNYSLKVGTPRATGHPCRRA